MALRKDVIVSLITLLYSYALPLVKSANILNRVHSVEFFRRRGFFCRPDFLDEATRADLLERLRRASPTRAKVFDGAPDAVVNLTARNAWQLSLDDGPIDLAARLGALRADLSAHFHIPLQEHEGPTLLMYKAGGFYEPHVDRAGEDEPAIAPSRRRVSVVTFLNAMSPEPGPGDYAGGTLTFYGLIDDPAWQSIGFALDPMPGLLVAFPSHLLHEVTPVTAGDRYTIVDWFTI